MPHTGDERRELEITDNWPAYVQLKVFGYDDYFYGDVDSDGLLDRLLPNPAAPNYVKMTTPTKPFIVWTLVVDDATSLTASPQLVVEQHIQSCAKSHVDV
jgi:alpha-1,3-glucan synthase